MSEVSTEQDPNDPTFALHEAFDDVDLAIDEILKKLDVAEDDPAFLHSSYVFDDVALLHGEAYDPAKAREYYLRTRHLKGRRRGQQKLPARSTTGRRPVPSSNHKSAKQLRAATQARVEALKLRLERLREVLKTLVEKAKARSGVDPKKDTKAKASTSTRGGSKNHMSLKERREARERAEKYRKKNQEPKTVASVQSDIAEVQAKINQARADLRASARKARKHAQSKNQTAPKGR